MLYICGKQNLATPGGVLWIKHGELSNCVTSIYRVSNHEQVKQTFCIVNALLGVLTLYTDLNTLV